MSYYVNHSFSAYDLFETFNKRQLKIKLDVIQKNYGVNKRQWLCASVLVYCFYLIILDIIENNVTFVLPLFNGKQASIFARPVVGEEFKCARRRGAFTDIDIIASNFTGYQLTYSWKSGTSYKHKPVYINKRFKDLFYDKINSGKQYY